MSSRVAFRPRRTYAFEFVKHRSFPPRCARGQDDISENMQRIYGHDTRNKSPRIVISSAARNLLLTKSWRTADSSSLRLLGMTRCKVSRQASTTPNIVISSEARNLLLGKDDPQRT